MHQMYTSFISLYDYVLGHVHITESPLNVYRLVFVKSFRVNF